MAIEYKGEDFLYLVEIPAGTSGTPAVATHRMFNQTGGSTSLEADTVDLDTKDKSGSDYGKVSQSISISGILTQGDPLVAYIKKAIRGKEFIKITEINTRTKDTETGMYMVNSFEQTYDNGDFAEYSLDADLNGVIDAGTLEEVPEGAGEYEGGGV